MKPDVAAHRTIFLAADEMAAMTAPESVPQDTCRAQTRIFTAFKAGR